jgi:periplasmic copper chaperone A
MVIRWSCLISVMVLLTAGLLLTACQAGSTPAEIQVEEVWGRPSPMTATVGVFYMKVKNSGGGADKLLSAKSDACKVIELHETIMEGDIMSMRPVEGGFVGIPAGEMVEFKTGGLHLMCVEMQVDFTPGAAIPLILEFESSGTIQVEAEIGAP